MLCIPCHHFFIPSLPMENTKKEFEEFYLNFTLQIFSFEISAENPS